MILTDADKQLIAEEESLFETTLNSLLDQLPEALEAKIAANREARELTRRVTTEWNDEERQPLVSDEAVAHRISEIRNESDRVLLELIREPYFGRVVTDEEDGSQVSFLIGIKGNIDAGIVDWRNGPISSLFFNYQQGEEFCETINGRERIGRIQIRRSYKVQDGRLTEIDMPEGVYRLEEGGWIRLDPEEELGAHRSRGLHSREKRLPSILSLITPEQFSLITTDPHRPVIIQGSAGSGKTTVALHRLAWLLQPQGDRRVDPRHTRVVVMNKSLQVYVSHTLPSMGIEGVPITTFNSWALATIRQAFGNGKIPNFKFREIPSFVEEIKFSEEILAAIAEKVAGQVEHLDRAVAEETLSDQSGLQEIWKRHRSRAILPRLRDFLHQVRNGELPADVKTRVQVDLQSRLDRLEDYVEDVFSLLSDMSLLERHLKRDPRRREHLEFLRRLTTKNREQGHLDYFDLSLMLRLIQLKNGGLPGPDGAPLALDHLVVDEAQDFGPVEFAVMVESLKDKRHVTIVGDVAQKILFSRKFVGWDQLTQSLGIKSDELIRLEVSFRCTAEIMNLARKVEGKPGAVEGRRGAPPVWERIETRDEILQKITDWVEALQARDPLKLIALICRYPKQALELKEDLDEMIPGGVRLGRREMFSFEPGVLATNIHQVKGLEFDSVALIEPSDAHYPHRQPENRNLLYVGITRAQDDLLLISEDEFSKFLL